jgi:hypothetical protein
MAFELSPKSILYEAAHRCPPLSGAYARLLG